MRLSIAALCGILWLASSPGSSGQSPVEGAAVNRSLPTFDRVWETIRDSYWDPRFNGIDWDAAREEFRPRAEKAADIEELRRVLRSMLGQLGASHMEIIPGDVAGTLLDAEDETDSPGGEGDFGFELRPADGRFLVTRVDAESPAGRAGVQPGWALLSVDGRVMHPLFEKVPESRHERQRIFWLWRAAQARLLGLPGRSSALEFEKGSGEKVALALSRRFPVGAPAKLGDLPTMYSWLETEEHAVGEGSAGLIRFNVWMIAIARPIDEAVDRFRKAEGIIIDLRGNLGGMAGMVMGVSGHFLEERELLGTMKMRGAELQIRANPRWVSADGEPVKPYAGPVAVLVDAITLSAAEIFAGGMQDIGRVRVFGSQTGGQALPAVWNRLPNGDILYHAIADFVTGTGRRLEGGGVIPDEPVAVTREQLLQGRDPVLEAALAWIQDR